ncbi:MAG: ubiquinol-cytochrome c reductase iron-sulfur subunit [Desulfatirhabdiaceae bacterium]
MAKVSSIVQPPELFCLKRRDFTKIAAMSSVAVALTGIPLLTYIIAPTLEKGANQWIDLGAVDSLKPGQTEMLSYDFMVKDGWQVLPQRGFVWARMDTPEKFTIFSSTCTHLACNVIWQMEKQIFECPCHSGRFDAAGSPISGPPTKPLKQLDHKIEEGKLLVFMSV